MNINKENPMLTLHHLSQSRSFRILWLLEELKAEYGTDYTLITHQRQPNFLAPDALLAIHPMGKAPFWLMIHCQQASRFWRNRH